MNINFKKVPEERVLFFDGEMIRKNKILDPNSTEFALYQKKLRNRETDQLPTEEETIADYNKRAALKIGFTKVITIGVGFIKGGKAYVKHLQGTEEEIFEQFFAISNQFDYLCGYNILGYDLPVIYTSAINYMDYPVMIKDEFNTSGKKPWELRHILDLYDIFKGTHYSSLSLEEVCYHFGIPSSKKSLDGSKVSEVYYSEGIEPILNYVKDDVLANINVFRKMRSESLFEEYIDRSDVKIEVEKPDFFKMIYNSNYFSDASKQGLRDMLSKKKLTKKDKDFVRDIILSVYVNSEFMNEDKQDVIEAKTSEVDEFIKTL